MRQNPRRVSSPRVHELESRALLNATVVPNPSAEIRALSLLPPIHGSVTGTVTSITNVTPTTEVVKYTLKGNGNLIGAGTGVGQHTITRKPVAGHPTNDTYSKGALTIKASSLTIAVTYTGQGHTNSDGSFSANLHGTARSTTGITRGLSGSFTAQLIGDMQSSTFTINFTIKV